VFVCLRLCGRGVMMTSSKNTWCRWLTLVLTTIAKGNYVTNRSVVTSVGSKKWSRTNNVSIDTNVSNCTNCCTCFTPQIPYKYIISALPNHDKRVKAPNTSYILNTSPSPSLTHTIVSLQLPMQICRLYTNILSTLPLVYNTTKYHNPHKHHKYHK
jgi:hypothetical protein